MDRLEIRLLGSMQLMRGELSLTNFGSNKVRALLSYLVVESAHPHQRRKLAALLWPELPETSALSNLRYALSNLRKVIDDHSADPPYLIITPQTIQFNANSHFTLDAAQFDAYAKLGQQNPLDIASLLKAGDLCQGRFLEGFSIPDSVPFEEWLIVKRERFDQLAYQVFHALAKYYLLVGNYDQAITFAQRQIALDRWREEAYRLIMRCLFYSGQRSAAIAQYEHCCDALGADLGISPSPDTVRLFDKILEGQLTLPPSLPAFFVQPLGSSPTRAAFVDREEPLTHLFAALDAALHRDGQIVFVTGSPGQGKTALLQEFIQQALVSHPGIAAAWGNSHAYFGSGDPFLPFREIFEMLTGQVEHRWEAGAMTHDHARRMWLLTEVCALALVQHGSDLINTFVPGELLLQRASYVVQEERSWLSKLKRMVEGRHEKTPPSREVVYQQYCQVLLEIAHQVPLILFVDDMQWADESSLGLFFQLSRQLSGAKILLLGAFRPVDSLSSGDSQLLELAEMVNELKFQHGDILIDLDEFIDRHFIDAYLDLEPNQLGEDFREDLFKHTHSHPLFTVEMLFEMKSQGNLLKTTDGKWTVSEALNWDQIPAKIEAAIEKRLSQLPNHLTQLLHAASVEGDIFTAEVIASTLNMKDEKVLDHLHDELDHHYKLIHPESSRRVNGGRLTRYRFTHILFQKYIYNQLDVVERIEMHEQVGEAMEQRYAAIIEEMYVPLAIHFELAGHPVKTIHYLELAGKNALRFSSYVDALDHYKKAHSLLNDQPETTERDRKELNLLLSMSVPVMLLYGFASAEMGILCDQMVVLLKSIPLDVEMFPIFHSIGAHYQMRAEHQQALDLLRQAEALALRSEEELFIRIVNWGCGFSYLWLGNLEEAYLNLNRMVDFYDPKLHSELRQSYGVDAGIASRIWSSWTLWLLGYPEQALNRGQQAIDLSNLLGDPGNQQIALDLVLFLYLLIGEKERTSERLNLLGELLEESPLPIHYADFVFLQGFYRVLEGEFDGGIDQLSRGLRAYQACGTRSQLSLRMVILAEAYIKDKQYYQAAQVIQEAEVFIEETGERFFQSEMLRVKGEMMFGLDSISESEACYLEGLQLARQQKARTLELRAAISLARLWKNQGRGKEAYQLLDGVYRWFTEGFDTADLLQARVLLEDLGQTWQDP